MSEHSPAPIEILETLAEGSFGTVCIATLLSGDMRRTVALKILRVEWSDHQEVLSRTRDEARLLALLNHRNIVRVDELMTIGGRPVIVMEYVPGVGLDRVIKEAGRTPLSVAVNVVGQVAAALDAAYNRPPPGRHDPLRVIHRDIKPSNILFGVDAEVKVLDFGTARADFELRESLTDDVTFGSMGYLAPERLDGVNDEPATDVYALGVTLYELLAGRAFGQLSVLPSKQILQLRDRLREMEILRGEPGCETRVRELIEDMVHFDFKQRPAAGEVARRCREIESKQPVLLRESLEGFARRVVEPLFQSRPHFPPPRDLLVALDDRAMRHLSDLARKGDTRPMPRSAIPSKAEEQAPVIDKAVVVDWGAQPEVLPPVEDSPSEPIVMPYGVEPPRRDPPRYPPAPDSAQVIRDRVAPRGPPIEDSATLPYRLNRLVFFFPMGLALVILVLVALALLFYPGTL